MSTQDFRESIESPRLDRRAFAGGAAALVAAGMLSGVSAQEATPGASAVPEGTPGGVLRVGVQGDPTELDPHLVVLDAASLITDLVYEGLVHEDAALVPQPLLAESWDISDDGTTYTFHLRSGVTFHNGRPMVADDVVYSIARVMDPDTASPWVSYTDTISDVQAPDDATVVFTLTSPDASFLAKLCRRGLTVVPQEEVEAHGDLKQVMVGTGPFIFDEYVPNSIVKLSKNGQYWLEGRPYLDGLEIQIIPDDTARTTALVSDTVDFIEQVPHKDIETLEASDDIALTGDQATNLRWIVFNVRKEPFNNKDFRRAVASGIDRQPIIDTAVFGYGTPLYGMYPSDYWAGYEGDIPAADPDGAEEAIAQLALPEGFKPGILTWGEYDFLSNTSVVVQEQLRQIGVTSEIDPQENAIYLERYFGGDFDIAVMGAGGYIDPNDFMQQSLGTDGPSNAAGYSNPDLDDLMAEGLREDDLEARKEIYQRCQELIIDDAPWIMLYTSNTFEGMRANVKGFVHSLSGSFHALRETWIEQE
ncbi:MAG TPA: ABC transporter substrate-binding protein [Thermomicrobiales bacterium]|nr:ABC transporter substrate-binding protein [Thermomicrobiales bacterium]